MRMSCSRDQYSTKKIVCALLSPTTRALVLLCTWALHMRWRTEQRQST
uniref:Uncharacterized protein n=1 Tax=Arundo donax TaxID=35708 RepID=A0A0A8YUW4_ARUDO